MMLKRKSTQWVWFKLLLFAPLAVVLLPLGKVMKESKKYSQSLQNTMCVKNRICSFFFILLRKN